MDAPGKQGKSRKKVRIFQIASPRRGAWPEERALATALVASATAATVPAISTIASATVATTTATGTASAATTTAAEFTARRTIRGRAGLTDRNGPAVKGFTVELFNGSLAFLRSAHGDKAEAAWALGGAVEDEVGIRHRTDSGEEFFQCAFRGLEGEVADVKFHISLAV